jgi:hypothetical protein
MMSKFFVAGAVGLLSMQAAIGQQQYGNAVEARAMLERVVAGIKADPAGTIALINKSDPKFSDRDLYPTCAGPDGKMVANPNPARLGIVQKDSKDASGKPYGEELAKAFSPRSAFCRRVQARIKHPFRKPHSLQRSQATFAW